MQENYHYLDLEESCKVITIDFLNQFNYLVSNKFKTGTICWNPKSNPPDELFIQVYTFKDKYEVVLSHAEIDEATGKNIHTAQCKVFVIKDTTGEHYFICPVTMKKCKKLHKSPQSHVWIDYSLYKQIWESGNQTN